MILARGGDSYKRSTHEGLGQGGRWIWWGTVNKKKKRNVVNKRNKDRQKTSGK